MALERQPKQCVQPGCGLRTSARGLCSMHYQRARANGNLPPVRKFTIKDRLMHGHSVDPASGCWLWGMAKDSNGYGMVTVGTGKSRGAHRESYKAFVGEIPSGMKVCHRCDVPSCINPEHLFLGTQKDNMHDCSAKGRVHSCLSKENVLYVRMSSASASALSQELGVGKHVIYKARRGSTYRAYSISQSGKHMEVS